MALNSAQVLHVLYRKLPYITQQSQLFNPIQCNVAEYEYPIHEAFEVYE